jgi:cysteine-rich repeat protein
MIVVSGKPWRRPTRSARLTALGVSSLAVAQLATATTSVDHCPDPPPYRCANGVVEADEGCDDGNSRGGDGCAENCTLETRHRFRVSPLVGGSAFRRLDGATQALAVGGEVVLTLGGLRASWTATRAAASRSTSW